MEAVYHTITEDKLSTLTAIRRADGTGMYYCFSEVQAKLFACVPIGTVKSWLRFLKIKKLKCTNEEHNYYKAKLPDICKGAFKLINAADVRRLICYSESRQTYLSPKIKRQKLLGINESQVDIKLGNSPSSAENVPTYCSDSNILHARSVSRESNLENASLNDVNHANFVAKYHSDMSQDIGTKTLADVETKGRDMVVVSNVKDVPITCSESKSSLYAKLFLSPDSKLEASIHSVPSFNETNSLAKFSVLNEMPQVAIDREIAKTPRLKTVLETPPKKAQPQTLLERDIPIFAVESSDSSSEDLDYTNEGNMTDDSFKFKTRFSRKLSLSEIDENVKKEIEDLKSFYTRPLNVERTGHALQKTSIDKIIERLLVFFKYGKSVRGSISLKDVEDSALVENFCNFLRSNNRKLQSITVSRYISAFISAVRFLHREKSAVAQENMASLSRLRGLQSQLEFDAKREKKPSNRRSIMYEEILEIARDILHEFEDSSIAMEKARSLMHLCILLLYTQITGRCKEFVTLRLVDNESKVNSVDGNFLVHERDSTLILLCNDYKTSKRYGPDKTELKGAQLEYYFNIYINSYRIKLLQGNVHDYFLVNTQGGPFSVSSFNKYIGQLFQKHCNLRLTVNDLRHSIVTYFLSLPEANDNQLMESLATVMKHSVRTQRRYYDDRSREVKKEPALRVLALKANSTIFEDETNDEAFKESEEQDEDGYVSSLPLVGDIVALVASNSTRSSPAILLAKVLRYSIDKKEVLLAHFDEISENAFRMVTGKSYTDSSRSLIFPVDIVYNSTDRLYHLRSDKLSLYLQTRP